MRFSQSCQIFLCTSNQNGENLPKKAIQITKNAIKILTGNEMHQNFPSRSLQKYTQIGIFGMKINHLATLVFPHILLKTMK
jgi:hypothetical protein